MTDSAAHTASVHQGPLFLRCNLPRTRLPCPSSSSTPSIMPPPCCWFQEAEAGILVCFHKSLTSLTVRQQRHVLRRNMTVSR